MATDSICFHIAVIGPSDTTEEVVAARSAISELSNELSRQGITLAFHHWSQLPPGLDEPQGYIDQNLSWADIDFVIGFMCKRFGAPVSDAESGTTHEVNIILEHHSKTGSPELLFYFHTEAADQSPEIAHFATQLRRKALTGSYDFAGEIKPLVLEHLRKKIAKISAPPNVGIPHTIGPLPLNRRFTVEMMMAAQMHSGEVPLPTIVVFKNGVGEEYIFDTRDTFAMQAFCNWIFKSMGFDTSKGTATLPQYLVANNQSNIKNAKPDEPIVAQLWLGHLCLYLHKKLGQITFKLGIAKMVHTAEDRATWLPVLTKDRLMLPRKHIRIDEAGGKEYTL